MFLLLVWNEKKAMKNERRGKNYFNLMASISHHTLMSNGMDRDDNDNNTALDQSMVVKWTSFSLFIFPQAKH